MIRKCDDTDFEVIYEIINDGAQAYEGVIPADRLKNLIWTEMNSDTKSTLVSNFGAMKRLVNCLG